MYRMSAREAIHVLLNLTSSARVRLLLFLRYPSWFTVEEISQGLLLFSRQRIQQILQREYESQRVLRRRRESDNPGPNPFEYQVTPAMFTDIDQSILNQILRLAHE